MSSTATFLHRFAFRPHSLAVRLAVLLATISIGTGVIVFFFVLEPIRNSIDRAEQRQKWELAAVIAERLQESVDPTIDYPMVSKVLSESVRMNPDSGIYLIGESGEVIVSLSRTSLQKPVRVDLTPVRKFLQSTSRDMGVIYAADPEAGNRLGILSAAEIRVLGRPAYVYAVLNPWLYRLHLQAAYQHGNPPVLFRLVAIIILFFSIIGFLFLLLLGNRLNRIVRVAEAIGNGNLQARVSEERKDELGMIGVALNSMAEALVSNIRTLEAKDELRRQLIADVSHDLRGPVASLQIVSETLLERFEQIKPEERETFLKSVRSNTEALSELIETLFTLARLEARELVPRFEEIPVRELLSGIVSRFTPIAERKGITLTLKVPEIDLRVLADGEMLERILSNLIENSLRHTPNGGTLSLTVEAEESIGKFSVRDSGSGIETEMLSTMFHRFISGSESSGNQVGAAGVSSRTGLGLSIVQKLAEAHGSSVEVSSEKGVGTEFRFELPRVRANSQGTPVGST